MVSFILLAKKIPRGPFDPLGIYQNVLANTRIRK